MQGQLDYKGRGIVAKRININSRPAGKSMILRPHRRKMWAVIAGSQMLFLKSVL